MPLDYTSGRADNKSDIKSDINYGYNIIFRSSQLRYNNTINESELSQYMNDQLNRKIDIISKIKNDLLLNK